MSDLVRVQYVGLAGFHNLGDDVLREAFIDAVPKADFRSAPVGRKALLRRGLAHMIDAKGAPALLGGGTVLGRTVWRTHLRRIQRLFAPVRWEMLGAGVEDPAFVGTGQYTSDSEIERWKPILGLFRNVTVRGPRSQAILAEHGIGSTVVGDPALLLVPSAKPPHVRERDLLVNVTCGEDQWGGIDLDWTPALVSALKPIVASGATVDFISMEATDDIWNRRVADALHLDAAPHKPTNHQQFFALASTYKLVIGTRLHCNVLATVVDTPTISLEYRPKSRDFMESIGCGALCYRVDELDPEEIRRSIVQILNETGDARMKMHDGVASLQMLLRAELRAVCTSLLDQHIDLAST